MKNETKIDFSNMCSWEIEKAGFLISESTALGMENDVEDLYIGVNPNSGYTYLWNENYCFSLYMPINCELKREDIYVLYMAPNGIEYEVSLGSYRDIEHVQEAIEKGEWENWHEA